MALDDELRERVRAHVQANGLRGTALRLGLHPETLLRFLAKAPARPGSALLVRERVERVLGL